MYAVTAFRIYFFFLFGVFGGGSFWVWSQTQPQIVKITNEKLGVVLHGLLFQEEGR